MSEERQMELAERLDETFRARALAEVRAQAHEAVPQDWDRVYCYDCGGNIPPKRLELGKFRCVECQEIKERGSQLFRR